MRTERARFSRHNDVTKGDELHAEALARLHALSRRWHLLDNAAERALRCVALAGPHPHGVFLFLTPITMEEKN